MEPIIPVILMQIASTGAADTALPDRTDIPSGFSSVVCEDKITARRMFDDYYKMRPAPKNFGKNTDLFFEGLKTTGCRQKSQIKDRRGKNIQIEKVHQRKFFETRTKTVRYILYSGRWDDGKSVYGIVDEGWNNRFPRTDLAEWLSQRAVDGWLKVNHSHEYQPIFYRCNSVPQARTAVKMLKSENSRSNQDFEAQIGEAAKEHGCRKAMESYFVTARHERVDRDCGHECWYEINALEAIDRSGQKVGLIYDGALM